jgi:5-methylcytosine-specific restriction enzyme A
MMMPKILKSGRAREFASYDDQLKSEVIKGWLFEGLTHRELDERVLGLDKTDSRGWQSMGILHFLGLKKEFSGIFHNLTLQEAIGVISQDEQDFGEIIQLLADTQQQDPLTLKTLQVQEATEIKISQNDSSEQRMKRIKAASKKPARMSVVSYTYKRNADVVTETLLRAKGVCDNCGKPGPFVRASDGTIYLEVHHVRPLSQGGEDTLKNVRALCPNCHRQAHFG